MYTRTLFYETINFIVILKFVNQACPQFLEIAFVQEVSMCVCVRVCVCMCVCVVIQLVKRLLL